MNARQMINEVLKGREPKEVYTESQRIATYHVEQIVGTHGGMMIAQDGQRYAVFGGMIQAEQCAQDLMHYLDDDKDITVDLLDFGEDIYGFAYHPEVLHSRQVVDDLPALEDIPYTDVVEEVTPKMKSAARKMSKAIKDPKKRASAEKKFIANMQKIAKRSKKK